MGKKKKKKEQITYIDDGSTIADMSSVGGGKPKNSDGKKLKSTLKQRTTTYFEAVKMMFGPMMVTITILGVTFLIVWLLLFLFG